MATVFFKVSPQQEKEIKSLMKEEGYSSKAEFFRFLLKFYKYQSKWEKVKLSPETQKEADELAALVTKLNREGKIKDNLDEVLGKL